MFCKDSRTEQFLTQLGVEWKYVDKIKYEQLAPNWESQNLGRPKARIEEAMIEYGTLMESGSPAPAPILQDAENFFPVLDGVQRLGGGQLIGCTSFPAYIVSASEDIARLIRILSNHRLQGGYSETAQWSLQQAVAHLVVAMGMSCQEVARLGGWKSAAVEKEEQYQRLSFKIRCIGGPEELNKGIVEQIGKVVDFDAIEAAKEPVAQFCQDLKRGRFGNGEAKPYIDQFFDATAKIPKGKLHKELTRRLDVFHADREVKTRLDGRPSQRRDPETKLRGAMRTLLTVTEEVLKTKTEIPYVDEFFQLLNQIRANLQKLGKKSLTR